MNYHEYLNLPTKPEAFFIVPRLKGILHIRPNLDSSDFPFTTAIYMPHGAKRYLRAGERSWQTLPFLENLREVAQEDLPEDVREQLGISTSTRDRVARRV